MISIKSHLADLERNQSTKSDDQRIKVPTLAEIAEALEMHEKSFLRIANNQVQYLDLDKLDTIIEFLRSRGFNTEVSDLIVYKSKDQIS